MLTLCTPGDIVESLSHYFYIMDIKWLTASQQIVNLCSLINSYESGLVARFNNFGQKMSVRVTDNNGASVVADIIDLANNQAKFKLEEKLRELSYKARARTRNYVTMSR